MTTHHRNLATGLQRILALLVAVVVVAACQPNPTPTPDHRPEVPPIPR
jgi:hypothetical protein